MCHQAGYENTVAASGTALTPRHLQLLKRYTDNLILAFDMDVAGDSATKRGIGNAQELGFNIKIIEHYGDNAKKSDPADIIQQNPKIWEESLAKAKGIMDYYVDSAFAQHDKTTPQGKKEIGNIVLPAIRRLANKIEQAYWVQTLAQKLGISELAVQEELLKVKGDPNLLITHESPNAQTADVEGNKNLGAEGRKKLLEEKIVALVLRNPEFSILVTTEYHPLFSEKVGNFLRDIHAIVEKHEPAREEEVKKELKLLFEGKQLDVELKNFMAALALRAEVEYQEDGKEEVLLCLLQLKNLVLKEKLQGISTQIKEAEAAKDQAKIQELIGEFNNLSKGL
jgi:DNA primase